MFPVKAIRGMLDIVPEEVSYWQHFEAAFRNLAAQYGYQECRFPLVESTALFKRSIGEITDIVEKEMFTFTDRDGQSISLRPEGTASCVRMCIEQGLLHHEEPRLWYMGPMYRYERPQKGRYRQFHQVGVEAFGYSGPEIEVEHILMMKRLWETLKITPFIRLEINSLGSLESRDAYRQVLVQYFEEHKSELDEDSLRRLKENPLRILDSKNSSMQSLIQNAPKFSDYLDEASLEHFDQFKKMLNVLGVSYLENPRLVRGLDYYNRTVYEWVTDALGSQGTVCAGGRFDGLVEQLGGRSVCGVGFALGVERVLLLQKEASIFYPNQLDIYCVAVGEGIMLEALKIVEKIRNECPEVFIKMTLGGSSFKSQFKKADKSGAQFAVIIGEEELREEMVSLKHLRDNKPQEKIPLQQLIFFLNQLKRK